MALQSLTGGLLVPIGPNWGQAQSDPAGFAGAFTVDAVNEAVIMIGRVINSDGGSHTIDTTGSSSLGWKSNAVTFASGSTVVKIGLAAVDTANGPPGRAANSTNVITFDVSDDNTGGAGGITANAWQTSVPTTGTKTIANGDYVAFAVQMTARGGTDSVTVYLSGVNTSFHQAGVTTYLGAAYAAAAALPNMIITYSDGALGYFHASDIMSTISTRTWNSGDATKEYGQLYDLPFPYKVHGLYGWIDPDADCDVVLYSDPLGTPVAEKTISLDANTMASATIRRFIVPFAAPYSVSANQKIGAVFKPGGSNVSTNYKTIASATHRVADSWGTTGYGISRASGAFANANSSLDHYHIGLIVGAFEHGVWPSGHLGV